MRGSKVRCTAFLASRYMKLMGATTTIEQRFCLYHHGRLSTRDVVKANQKAMKKRRSDNKTIIGTLSWFVCPLWFALSFSVPTSLNIPPIIRTILLTVHFMQSIRISLSTLTTPLILWCCPLSKTARQLAIGKVDTTLKDTDLVSLEVTFKSNDQADLICIPFYFT